MTLVELIIWSLVMGLAVAAIAWGCWRGGYRRGRLAGAESVTGTDSVGRLVGRLVAWTLKLRDGSVDPHVAGHAIDSIIGDVVGNRAGKVVASVDDQRLMLEGAARWTVEQLDGLREAA